MKALQGKKAVVTGGSRGIGRAIVERIASEGAQVVFSYAQSESRAVEVEEKVAQAGGKAQGVQADFTDPANAERLMKHAEDLLGGLDVLVNNVAMAFTPIPIAEIDDELYDQVMATNLKSTFLTTRYAARNMRDGGRVINISTVNTIRPGLGIALYTASKGAIEQLTAAAARELGPRGITVNTVSPGFTDTDLLRGANSEQQLAQIPAVTPLGRVGQPTDIAGVVAFLAGPDGRWVTGQNIRATGGFA
ncbi:SDR family NAD(P)-dependent oxidoreductase [Actinomadura nitritigenes]|uniref:SDR family NAD(P)-dependent oxidoreductase n=1 Tax=Actinomadura nitritigenes TaxID=134602 RepID=UPI003D91626B